MRALDRVNVDFSTLEMALKKRLAEVTGLIEQEVCDDYHGVRLWWYDFCCI